MNKLEIIQMNYDGVHTDHKGIFAEIMDYYSRTVVNLSASYTKTKAGATDLLGYCIDNAFDETTVSTIHDHLAGDSNIIIVDGIEYKAEELNKFIVF